MTKKVNYIIAAQDATKDAIRSIQANFKTLDRTVKSTAQGISLGLSFIAGAAIKGMFRASLDATAEATGKNSEFTKSLEDVRAAARNLMVPKDGLPGVTENLKELSNTLKDPAVVSAADALFSSLLRGGTAAVNVIAQTTAGIRILATQKGGDRQVDLDNKILELQKMLKGLDSNPRNSVAQAARADIQKQIDDLTRLWEMEQKLRSSFGGDRLSGISDASGASKLIGDQVAAYEAADAAAKEYADTVKELNQALERMPVEMGAFADAAIKDILRGEQESADNRDKYFRETQDAAREAATKGAEEARKMLESTSEFAKEAARNMQDALAQFLFDPFHDGLKGMLKGFVDTIRRMVAEAAASKIFDLFGGNDVVKTIGSFFGFKAEGGPVSGGRGYIVGEKGPEWFQPGGSGFITPNYALAGGGGVTNHFTIDARGAGPDVEAKIQRALAQAAPMIVDASRRAVKDDFSRRAIR